MHLRGGRQELNPRKNGVKSEQSYQNPAMTTKEQLLQDLEQAPEDVLTAALLFVRAAKETAHHAQASHPMDELMPVQYSDRPENGIQSLLALLDSMPFPPEEVASLPHDGAEGCGNYKQLNIQ
jgi:hypothetical protein